ncbi:MAG: hypothetical protein JSV91_13765 [Phycisphaerales bacterium]|nr:MAG: hypothetical protein JSV91_13765 [Phycisphaerales bacterium]
MHMFATTDAAIALDWMPPVLMVVAVILLGLIFTHRIRSKIDRRSAAQPTARQRIEQLKSAAHRQEDLQVVTAETLDTVQDLAARLSNRAERLEQLIARADELITRLGAAAGQALPAVTDAPRPEGEGSAEDAIAPTGKPALPTDPLTRSVYELADAGRNPVEIARELDEQIGKVELILALRRG